MKIIIIIIIAIFVALLIVGCKGEVDSDDSQSNDTKGVTIDIPDDLTNNNADTTGDAGDGVQNDDSSDSNIPPIEIEIN